MQGSESDGRKTAGLQRSASSGRMQAALVLILLAAFLLRVQGLAAQSFWYDEGFSVDLAGRGWREIALGELNLPPLYNLLLGGWVRAAGVSEFAARYLSVWWGVVAVALGGSLAALLLGRRAGALTALLLAVLPIEVWYAQEARMYAMLAALTLASSVALLRIMRGERGRRLWAAYTLATVAAVYVHYYAALTLASQAVWVLLQTLSKRDRRLLRYWLVAQGCLGLAIAPWLPIFWPQWRAANTTYWPGLMSWQYIAANTALGAMGDGLAVAANVAGRLALLAGALAAIGLLLGLWRARSRWGVLLLSIQVIVPLALFYALVHSRPKFSPRYLLPALPAAVALVANGAAGFWPAARRRLLAWLPAGLATVVVLGLTAGSAYAATNPLRDPSFGRDDLRGAAAFLSANAGENEAVLLLSGHLAPAFACYYHRDNCYPIPENAPASPATDQALGLEVLEQLDQALAGRQGAWLLLWQDDVIDPNGVVLAAFDRLATREPVEGQFRGLELRHYTLPPGTRLERDLFARTPVGASVGQGELTLAACDLPPAPVPSGGKASILLHWRCERRTPLDYRVEVQVLDELGQVRASGGGRLAGWMYPTDRWPAGRLITGRHDVSLPAGLPPGQYTARARVFAFGSDAAQLVPLGEFQVTRAGRPPALGDLGIAHPLMARLGEMEVLGYDLSPAEAAPGQTVSLALYLRALARPAQAYHAALTLGGRPWASPPLPASVAEMEPGDIFRVQFPLPLPRDAVGGEQPVTLTLQGDGGAASPPPVELAVLAVHAGERSYTVPETIQHPLRFSLGEGITLLGYDLDRDTLRAGEAFHLTLYWQAVQPMDTSYTAFVHLLDGQEKIWGQVDAIPGAGGRPTTGWLPGEVLADSYEVTARADAPQGPYVVEIGLYDAASLERLPVRDSAGRRVQADRILLSPMQLLPPS